jgi:chaperonin GroES
MKPIRNQILFKPFMVEEKSEGGIFVPDSYRAESDKGIIVDTGRGTKDHPMYLKKGDVGFRVHKWGTLIENDGESLYLMEDSAILATI